MNLMISKAEQAAIRAFKGTYATLTADAKEEIHAVVKADLGLMAAHPWLYTLGWYAAGIASAVIVPIIWHAL